MNKIRDNKTVGYSVRGKEILTTLKEDGVISEMLDGFNIAVALALAHGEIAPKDFSRAETYLNMGSVSDELKLAVSLLCPQADEGTARTMERLAEWGIVKLHELVDEHGEDEIPVAEIMAQVQARADKLNSP